MYKFSNILTTVSRKKLFKNLNGLLTKKDGTVFYYLKPNGSDDFLKTLFYLVSSKQLYLLFLKSNQIHAAFNWRKTVVIFFQICSKIIFKGLSDNLKPST